MKYQIPVDKMIERCKQKERGKQSCYYRCKCYNQCFSPKLPYELFSSCAQCFPYTNFKRSCSGAANGKCNEINAGHQQDQHTNQSKYIRIFRVADGLNSF